MTWFKWNGRKNRPSWITSYYYSTSSQPIPALYCPSKCPKWLAYHLMNQWRNVCKSENPIRLTNTTEMYLQQLLTVNHRRNERNSLYWCVLSGISSVWIVPSGHLIDLRISRPTYNRLPSFAQPAKNIVIHRWKILHSPVKYQIEVLPGTSQWYRWPPSSKQSPPDPLLVASWPNLNYPKSTSNNANAILPFR